MESREQRIATLASTLKSSGIAKSESQARMMAEEMIGVEEHVQRNYEEKHARAHEHLQTSKNLGAPRYTVVPTTSSEVKPESKSRIEPISLKVEPVAIQGVSSKSSSSNTVHRELPDKEYTDVSFGKKTLNQAFSDHNTHNAALESIKAQIQSENSVRDVDEMIGDVADAVEGVDTVKEETDNVTGIIKEIDDAVVQQSAHSIISELESEPDVDSETHEADEQESLSRIDNELGTEEISIDAIDTENSDVTSEESSGDEEKVKLDTDKLVDMMEEDGKLEEHTREITEKPKDVKPKEEYVENGIDLSNVFNFNKR
ncbi:MAG: hypothetical protein ACP5NW_02020 [Candidatus Woesearchaeota archaeon]